MAMEYLLKHTFNDFVVEELPALTDRQEGEYCYSQLEKSGMTTFEALEHLAKHFQIDFFTLEASGLKDEDAITRQVISLQNVPVTPVSLYFSPRKWLHLSKPLCFSDKPKVRGSLFGNYFWIVIRNLDPDSADQIQETAQPDGFFKLRYINYFDSQRFGLPGSEYRTADIGAALVMKDVRQAAQILYEESREVLKNRADLPEYQLRFVENVNRGMDLEEAFACIHQRVQAFFMTSYFS